MPDLQVGLKDPDSSCFLPSSFFPFISQLIDCSQRHRFPSEAALRVPRCSPAYTHHLACCKLSLLDEVWAAPNMLPTPGIRQSCVYTKHNLAKSQSVSAGTLLPAVCHNCNGSLPAPPHMIFSIERHCLFPKK